MKTLLTYLFIFLFLIPLNLFSQNLVPNHDFELNDGTFNNCGGINGTVDVLNWNRNSNGTPDYHHENYSGGSNLCGLVAWPGAVFCTGAYPQGNNCGGWNGTTSYGGGQALMGFYFNKIDATREMAYAQLTAPMDVTKTYDISFAVRTSYNPTNNLAHCISHFGIAMTTWVPNTFDFNTVTNAQWFPPGGALDWVYVATEIADEDWTEYSWTYTPAFANQYLIIGAMADWPTVTWFDHDGSGGLGGYYQVDDVVIQEVVPLAKDELEIITEVLSSKEIKVNWGPVSVDYHATYELLKSEDGGNSFKKIGSVRGDEFTEFVTIDNNPLVEDIYYKVKIIEGDKRKVTEPVRVSNPFVTSGIEWNVKAINEGRLEIDFSAKNTGQSNFIVYDINGRKLLDQNISLYEGSNTLQFDVSDLTTGVYLCSLNGNSHKIIRVK